MSPRDQLAATIRQGWHDTGFYARADLDPETLDALATVAAEALGCVA